MVVILLSSNISKFSKSSYRVWLSLPIKGVFVNKKFPKIISTICASAGTKHARDLVLKYHKTHLYFRLISLS